MSYSRNNDGSNTPHRAMVRFFTKAIQNNFLSEQAGHPVYEDKEYVEIITPGDTKCVVEERAKDHHKREYAREYEAFKNNEELIPEGMPLTEWPPISPAMVLNLRAQSIQTVEQLAQVHDGILENLGMGARTLREKARLWLEQAEGGAPISRLLAEVEALKSQQAIDAKTIADLSAEVRRRPVESAA